jgi:pyruvate formate lyase activating enzyme
MARLIGYYCAEGSLNWHRKRANSGAVWFSFGSHEDALMKDVESIVRTTFGLRPRRTRQGNRTAVIVSSASLAAVFRATCGDSSAAKRVPREILQSTEPSVLRGFLSGYFKGDGYVTKRDGGLVLGSSSVSVALTYGVAQLLLSMGDIPRVYRARNPPTYEIEGRIVNRSDDYMVRLFVDEVTLEPEAVQWKASKVRVIETEEHFLLPIRNIEERQYAGPVYNIEVEEDHSYTANLMAVSNCQNFDISQRRKVEGIEVEPQDVVRMTLEQGCQGLAYTYNQPTIFMEFARDIGMAARKAGLMNIFVSNGYDTPEAVAEMPKFLDCITVDFKGSGETKFVQRYIGIPNADPIFDTIQRIRDTKATHIEITDLIVPQVGDDIEAAKKLSKFVYDELGPDTPIHFLRFHPDYKMNEFPWTPVETLEKHCEVATAAGLKYVYIGNVGGHKLEHTYCPGCGAIAIRRYQFDITGWYLDKHNKCKKCGTQLPIVGGLEKTFKQDRYYSVLHHR